MILLVFYAGLSISTGQVVDFGLSGFGMGLFLVSVNLMVLALVINIGWSRFKEERTQKVTVFASATQDLEDAKTFTKADFASVCSAIVKKSVSPSHVLVFHYTTEKRARRSQRSGIMTDGHVGGVVFSIRGPHQVLRNKKIGRLHFRSQLDNIFLYVSKGHKK